jgi:DNA polymerase III subunit gamma/tau
MSNAWHQYYRPDTISGLHSTTVREQLQKLLKSGRFPQVLLLAGPRGMGKTSTARIIAALLNDPANEEAVSQRLGSEPQKGKEARELKDPDYTQSVVARIKEGASLAVIELDAASHRGIDDVRALKEQVYLPPQDGLVKVVILDEVHMMTTEAFNALLKILEEPPAFTVFILATTELHKLPATVTSRATLIQFKQATDKEIFSALENLLKKEGIKYDEEGLRAVAVAAQGSFRDAVKLAELVTATQGKVTGDAVLAAIPKPMDEELESLYKDIISKDAASIVSLFTDWRERKTETSLFAQVWLQYLHARLIESVISENLQARVDRFLLQEFSLVSTSESSVIPLLGFELKALDLVFRAQDKKGSGGASNGGMGSGSAKEVKAQKPELTKVVVEAVASIQPVKKITLVEPPEAVKAKADNFVVPPSMDSAMLLEKWQDFVAGVKQKNSTVAAILNSAKPQRGENGQALIDVFYQFHKDQLQQPKFRKLLDDSVADILGASVTFEFRLATLPQVVVQDQPDDLPSLASELLV